ncbi:MAG: hypothetical protein BGO69_16975 [Bacteroidetes bacterium 46-16]|nr:MAG: hypothetical protein BGO69_16975 [Bacteroidetes bacterium 46-16]
MTKKISYASFIIALAILSSCKEKGPIIDLGGHTAKDSTYTAATEAPQQRVVLVEEFTGASCSNCPAAREILSSLETQHPNRIASLGLHIFNFTQSEPWEGAKYDFRTQEGTDLGNSVYNGISGMPVAGINRLAVTSSTPELFFSTQWSGIINKYLDSVPSVNLTISSSLNTAGDTAYIVVKAAYTQDVSTKNTLSVAITESDLIDYQEDPAAAPDPIDSSYNFKAVLRGFVSATLGSPVLDSLNTKTAGRVFTRSYLYKVNPEWKAEHCKVVAFISNAETNDKRVLQAAETELKQ